MKLFVSIGGIVAEIQESSETLARMYREYLVAPCEPDIQLAIGPGPEDWLMHERRDSQLWIAPDRRRASVVPLMGDGSIDRSLRMMMAEALPRNGGVLMHAAAALAGDHVIAFAGDSGAGKSTVARLIGADRMVADDTLAVDAQGVAWATPFHNWGQAIPRPRKGRLARVFILEPSEVDEVVPIQNRLSALMRHAMTGPPGYHAGELLDSVARLTRVPLAVLKRTLHGDLEEVLG